MQRYPSLFAGLLLLSATNAQSLPGHDDSSTRAALPQNALSSSRPTPAPITRDYGRLPLSFEPNQGQADRHVRFLTHSLGSALSLTSSEAIFTLPPQSDALRKGRTDRRSAGKGAAGALRMQLVGANSRATALTQQPLEGRVNYLVGRDPSQWHTDIPTFGKVGFQGVYPGVDVVYYGNQRHLEYDFVVAPHADPKQIQLKFAGAQGVRVDAAGDLILRAQGRELTWRKPTVYQQDATGKHAVAAHYRLKTLPNGQKGIGFALGRYDTARPLVIDPVLTYSTYLTSGSPGAAFIALDSAGSAYIVSTISSIFQSYIQIVKLNATGTALLYSTTLGPQESSINSGASGIVVDSSGDVVLTGSTDATDFPTTPGAFQTQHSSATSNGFVTKLNATGSGLLYSTFLGNGAPYGIALDSSGSAYLTGSTGATDFPTTAGAFQAVNHAPTHTNAFVTKLNPTGTALVYSTYLGGSVDLSSNSAYTDFGHKITVDSNGDAYVAGATASSDFPTTPGAFQKTNKISGGHYTAFVTKLNPTGTGLLYSTYFGGSTEDVPNGIAVDSSGNASVAGQTVSVDLPTTPGAFQRTFPQLGGHTTSFVTKLNPNGTALIYCTYLGGTYQGGPFVSQDIVHGIVLDSGGNAIVTGSTTSSNFPTTLGAIEHVQNPQGYPNVFVTKINTTGTALIYSTLFGGTTQTQYGGNGLGDVGYGVAIDSGGQVYVSGSTQSADFPTTPGALLRVTPANSFVTKLSTVPVFPDFNNDGYTDLIIQNSSTGQIGSWLLNGAKYLEGIYFSLAPPSDYAVVGVGDFSNTGTTTLVLQSRTTNQVALWYATGTNDATISGGSFVNVTPAAGWKVVGVGDFNGDGKSDLVFQSQTTGQIVIWFMNGYLYQGGLSLAAYPAAGWQVIGVGDFNGDGRSDIAFQNQTTGQIALWYMNGTNYIGGTVLTSVPAAGWKAVGVGDYNGDGSADLLFQNQTTNQPMVWYLQGGVHTGSDTFTATPPAGWKVVAPR